MKDRVAASWVLGVATLMLVACCRAEVVSSAAAAEWKLSTALGPAYALGKAGLRWATLIQEQSAGRLRVKLYPGATLAARDPAREFPALRDGAAELAVGSSLFWAGGVPALNVVGLPWLAVTDARLAALATEPAVATLAVALRDAGVEPLAFAPLGHRALALAGRNVAAPAQLTGLRVRVPGSPAVADLYTALGALPRTLAFAEAQSAIAAGALDAQDGSPSAFVAARLDAVGMTQVLDWKAIAEIAVFAVNRGAWDRWSTSDRAVVRTAALQTAAELPAMVREETDAALVDLRRRGFAVTRLTAAGHAAFAAAARDSYVKWAAIAGVELVRSAESQLHAVEP